MSTDHGLEQDFNSLQAQREAAEAYVKSQAPEGWRLIRERFADGGFSGGSLDRPALQRLLAAIRSRLIDVVVVYKNLIQPSASERDRAQQDRSRLRLDAALEVDGGPRPISTRGR